MPRVCTICSHEDVHAINEALVRRVSLRKISQEHDASYDALHRHADEHLPALLAKAASAEEVARADALLDRVEALQTETESVLERVRGTDNYHAWLAAIREMRRNLELIGEITKELDRRPTLNLHLNPEWLQLQAVVVSSLEAFPEARESVVRAIRGTVSGGA